MDEQARGAAIEDALEVEVADMSDPEDWRGDAGSTKGQNLMYWYGED